MGFTVYKPGGTTDIEFEAYARLLRQMGVDLGRVPRVPDPDTDNRWLYTWSTCEEASSFAEDLKTRTQDVGWEVTEVQARPSVGPLGPMLIMVSRQADGFHFESHPLTRAMLGSAFPEAVPSASNTFVSVDTWLNFRDTQGNLEELIREIVPSLTGLSAEEIESVGFRVIDADSETTVAASGPAEAG